MSIPDPQPGSDNLPNKVRTFADLGPTQKELYDLICEFKDKGLTVKEIYNLNTKRSLRLPSAKSQVQRTLKALRKMNLVYAVSENDSKTLRYYPVNNNSKEVLP